MFGGCDEDDIVSMTQDLALSEGYDVAVFVQVKGLELGTSSWWGRFEPQAFFKLAIVSSKCLFLNLSHRFERVSAS